MKKPFLANFESFPQSLECDNGTSLTRTMESSDEDEYLPTVNTSTISTESLEASDEDECIQI